MIEISQHAYDRASERYSLNRKSFTRLAQKAFEQGKRQNDLKGKFKRYVSYLAKEYKSSPIVFVEFLFFFNGKKLITTYQVESKYKKYLKL